MRPIPRSNSTLTPLFQASLLAIRVSMLSFGAPVLLFLATGCAGNSMSEPETKAATAACASSASAATQQVPVLITSDAALGPLLALELQIDSVTLTGSCGNTVQLVSQPLTIEWTHVNGVSEPLLLATVPQDTYTSAAATYENPNTAYLWPTKTDFVSNQVTTGAVTGQVNFPSPIVVNGSATSIQLDMLLSQPFQSNSKTDTVTPVFAVTQLDLALNPTIDTNGKESFRGLVASVQSASTTNPGQFTIVNQAGISLPVAVSSATQYQGVTGLTFLSIGAPVNIDVATQQDGSLLATRIQVENPAALGAWAGPLVVTDPQGAYAEVVPRQLEDRNAAPTFSNFPSYFALPGTQYQLYGGAIDLVDVPFAPTFSSFQDTALGQGLSVSYTIQQQSAAQPLTQAWTTTLVPRAISGTVTAISQSGPSTSYTIALASNDLLTTLNGETTITAYSNDGTQMETSAPLAVGDSVNMHGLLFNDGGTLKLVCDQVRLQIGSN